MGWDGMEMAEEENERTKEVANRRTMTKWGLGHDGNEKRRQTNGSSGMAKSGGDRERKMVRERGRCA
ncbi:hypothetical protein AHAS_Ahas18G0274100 [Arachis hypogaea]